MNSGKINETIKYVPPLGLLTRTLVTYPRCNVLGHTINVVSSTMTMGNLTPVTCQSRLYVLPVLYSYSWFFEGVVYVPETLLLRSTRRDTGNKKKE